MKRTFLSALLLCAALTAAADSQKVVMTTSNAVGSQMKLLVNATRSGVTVDWGNGTPVSYVPETVGGIQEITGTVAGETITLEAAKGLVMLSAENSGLTAIDLSGAAELESLYLQDNSLATIDVSKLSELRDLNVANNALKVVTLSTSKQPNLETLNLAGNEITATSFSFASAGLNYLNLADNNYKTLTLTKMTGLDALVVKGNAISTLTLTGPANLSLLDARNNSITKVNLPETGLPALEQMLLDENEVSSLDLSASTKINTLTIANNGASSLVLPNKPALQVYDCGGNALTFSSLPKSAYKPSVYFNYAPQADLDITGLGLHEGSWGSGYLPWLTMNPSYSDRSKTEYQLDLSKHTAGSTSSSVQFAVYSVENGEARLLEKAAAAHPDLDYSLVSGKITVLKEFKDLFVQLTDAGYPDLVINTNHFAVLNPNAEGIENIEAETETTAAYDLQGRRVNQAQGGIYIMNGKKIIIK